MIRRISRIALIACLWSPALLKAESNSPACFETLLASDVQERGLDRPSVEAELQKVLDQLAISSEDKVALSEAVMELYDSIAAGDVQASYQAAKDLEQLVKDLQVKYQKDSERGIFGTAKAVWKLATAIHDGNTWGIAKALWDLVWSLVD